MVPDLFNGRAAPHWLMGLFVFLAFNRGMAPPRCTKTPPLHPWPSAAPDKLELHLYQRSIM